MRKLKSITKIIPLCIALLATSCSEENKVPNTLTEKEKSEGWELLFDGHSLANWHIYNKGNVPSSWTIQNGVLYCDPNSDEKKGDLISNKEYTDYELKFDWKLEKEGNSGVFINVQEQPDIDNTYQSGPEYQLLDDAHPDFDKPLKKSGCLYTFTPQKNLVNTKMRTDWNTSRIVQKDGNITFYLNDVVTAEMDLKSKKWQDLVKQSHFKEYPEFGKHTKGHIALQDWSRGVSFRNIKIKEL